jgi:RND family efflux transporter MFP subunit
MKKLNLTVLLLLSLLPLHAGASESLESVTLAYQTTVRGYLLDGTVEAVNRSTITAQTGGQVEKILFDVDDYVEKGALVVQIKNTEQRAQAAQAEADVKSAAARLQEAQDEYRRIEGVFKKSLVSQSAMDKAETALRAARASHESAQARLAQAQEQLSYTLIRAPYSGIVTRRHLEVGEVASPGQPLISGISLDQLRVTVDVPQSLVQHVRKSGEALIHMNDGASLKAARITVFPFADPASNSFKVRLGLPEVSTPLFPGMFVKVEFHAGSREQLLVPSRSLVYRSEVTGVYVIGEGGKISFRFVRLGNKTDAGIPVLAGLEAGERIALDPIAAGALLKQQRTGASNE